MKLFSMGKAKVSQMTHEVLRLPLAPPPLPCFCHLLTLYALGLALLPRVLCLPRAGFQVNSSPTHF